jgi:hypothetical protein
MLVPYHYPCGCSFCFLFRPATLPRALVAWRCRATSTPRASLGSVARISASFVCLRALRHIGLSPRRVTVLKRVEQSGAARKTAPAGYARPRRSVRSLIIASLLRGHAVCSGCLSRCCIRPNKRRAAPRNLKEWHCLLPAARPRELVTAARDPRGIPAARHPFAGARRNASVRAANVAPRRCCLACWFAQSGPTFPPVPVARACIACGCA